MLGKRLLKYPFSPHYSTRGTNFKTLPNTATSFYHTRRKDKRNRKKLICFNSRNRNYLPHSRWSVTVRCNAHLLMFSFVHHFLFAPLLPSLYLCFSLLSLFAISSDSIRNVRFGLKVSHIGPKWDKSGAFSDQISLHFGSQSQNVLKIDLKKSRNCPICGHSDLIKSQI